MNIVLVTGGARAGKSRWAEQEAKHLGGDDVAYVATAEPRDPEMAARIAAHRAARPGGWATLEVPLDVPEAVAATAASVVLFDCVTLWVSNLMHASDGDPVDTAVERLLAAADARPGTLIAVTNEVGFGIVPDNPLTRAYRDALGTTNARIAERAERVVLLVAGIPLSLR